MDAINYQMDRDAELEGIMSEPDPADRLTGDTYLRESFRRLQEAGLIPAGRTFEDLMR